MKTYIMCSGGKDSVATCILAKENNIHVDAVVFSEFMFSNEKKIPAEHPLHYRWKYDVATPKLESMGFKVEFIRPDVDFVTLFHKKYIRSSYPDRIGKMWGFPIADRCYLKNYCKIQPLKKWCKKQGEFINILGYAYDEPKRLFNMHKHKNQRSLLEEYKVTEKEAFGICKNYNLLSPSYSLGLRDGCWFCPNKCVSFYAKFSKEYVEYWNELRQLSRECNTVSTRFKYDLSFAQVEKQIQEINGQVNMFDLLV